MRILLRVALNLNYDHQHVMRVQFHGKRTRNDLKLRKTLQNNHIRSHVKANSSVPCYINKISLETDNVSSWAAWARCEPSECLYCCRFAVVLNLSIW